ncbi:hypothetical protein K502DRAFT_345424 [Neoconidiobolus thromboides FSU 785]|nr:hypothetical protein K502DRAFT_345424 [Neoconidiobolus thromboides FSU 785]
MENKIEINNEKDDRKTYKIKSEIFNRLDQFLPLLKESNKGLEKETDIQKDSFIIEKVQDKEEIDIKLKEEEDEENDNKEENEGEAMIHMDLGLGVFDTNEESSNLIKDVPIIDLKEDIDNEKKKLIEEI